MDVIARCAFGLKIDALGNKGDPFIENAKSVFNPSINKTPVFLLPCTSLNSILFFKTLHFFIAFSSSLKSYVSQNLFHVWVHHRAFTCPQRNEILFQIIGKCTEGTIAVK
jgi:hypothetical protein